ncbi:MAG: agmatine deiminase family protein [Bacteroidia bacterium]
MKHLYSLIFLLSGLISSSVLAQAPLPAGMAPGELQAMPAYLQQPRVTGITTPPPGSDVRTMAEWEEIQALTITWTSYQSTLREIVRAARLETQVYIVCTDSVIVKNYLTNNSIPLSNIHYIIAPYNSVWFRDYGQNTVYTAGVDSLALVDWIYNRPRPKDDTLPSVIARTLGIPMYETTQAPWNLIHTGGNFMSDGFGTGFSSNLVVDENPLLSIPQIDTIMNAFMGINTYIKMPVLPYDGIHHIDMHMKLLDEQTLMVGQYPVGVADGPQIEANLQYVLSTYNSVYGTPYKVVRIPMPPDQSGDYPDQNGDYTTYTNAVFVNKTVILPTYYQQYDTTAIRIWEEALPGYNIVPVNCNSIIQASGAIHCITHSVGVTDPLLISHQPLPNTTNTTAPYQVDALIRHRSGIQTATLYWTTDTSQAWQTVTMNVNASPNGFTGFIPAQAAGTTVFYYIEATSVSGKTQVRPMPAPAGWWKFSVTGPSNVVTSTAPEFKPAYPNPSHGITCIPVSLSAPTTGQLLLTDMLGRTVQVIHTGSFAAGERNYFIDSTTLPAGAYHLVLQTETGRAVQPLMIR